MRTLSGGNHSGGKEWLPILSVLFWLCSAFSPPCCAKVIHFGALQNVLKYRPLGACPSFSPYLYFEEQRKEAPAVQGWSHVPPNHPLSSLQHQRFCCGRLTWLHLGARQISACKCRLREHEVGGGEEVNIPNLGYVTTSPSLLRSLSRSDRRQEHGQRERGSFAPQALELTCALLYSQSGNGHAFALSRKQSHTVYFEGEFLLLWVLLAVFHHLIQSILLNRNCPKCTSK